jgi:CubicO group peptidase (beta-lactamase class C family)
MMKRILRILLTGILILVIFMLAAGSLVYSPEFVVRLLRWGDADVYDHLKFPKRDLSPAIIPYDFTYQLDQEAVYGLFEELSGQNDFDQFLEKNGTQAFLVLHQDAIIYEEYYQGATRDSIVTSFSIAKSFTSALVGIAISEGHIKSALDPITEYLPELMERDPAFSEITIRDLLMMSSGIKYSEPPDDAATYYYPDLRELALEKTRIVGPPGEKFHYNNYHPLLLGMILERTTGTTVTEYLQDKIWTPIGMEFGGSWSLDGFGFEKMESGINARAVDFAKFGRLFLKNGEWNGVQVVPADWVETSVQPWMPENYYQYYGDSFIFEDEQGSYQQMWWGIKHGTENTDFVALGNHGQFIYLSPAKDLIILRFGERYGEFQGAGGWVELFHDFSVSW